ncbi:hypothetical protein JQX09_24695 [Sulfitobacter pseudonitzschiae]|uniref:Uncharacterized protein n=1 Tax=Pseudosulfitobacter pseudonitzschiae TaxID=1402135 RepID=A0A9Q2NU70_9RHOB|nr:hypothetical protein [Pseudosulfitobacter pseudonitzschiae]MBM2295112.1 hypothetical protein [Pseudosulfitobacter pseudonitzschiae]MBM2299333.1 hypothetical protein [Pseudosulfitobacter pseudonitzschiae]MBM2304946.1 hypothetical protein [Pseudosulfitobacter pseudonitzschiae]MBM2314723.1 hypothetical protein [Pseudosulfitobacter pseudonitzschiae]MBM2319631.1 hypothetical protein [Pseudosulfitobacter pseudonitzschiae]
MKREAVVINRFPAYEMEFHDLLMEFYGGALPASFDSEFRDLAVERHADHVEPFIGLSDKAREETTYEFGSSAPDLLRRHLMNAWLTEMAAFGAELEALPHQNLQQLYREIEQKTVAELAESKRNTEAVYFFHNARADAQFDHWNKMPLWECEEAAALSLGKDPKVVNAANLRKRLGIRFASSEFVKEYRSRVEIIERASHAGILENPINAQTFVSWARRTWADIPVELGSNDQKEPANKKSKSLTEIEHKQLVSTYKIIAGLALHLSGGAVHKEASSITKALDLVGVSLTQETVKKIIVEAKSYKSVL